MKNIFKLVLIGFSILIYNYWSSVSLYIIILLKLSLYLLIALLAVVITIYINDRVAYYKLTKKMDF